MSKKIFTKLVWINLFYLLCVIVFGAYVRATGSGAGCGNHWPLCNAQIIPQTNQTKTLIEYTHRMTSGILLILASLIWYLSRKFFPKDDKRKSFFSLFMFFLIVEALLGAMLVKLEHVADNISVYRGVSVSLHYVNTIFMVLSATLCLLSTRKSFVYSSFRLEKRFLFSLFLFLLVGISGAITALGDTVFPVGGAGEALVRSLQSDEHLFVRLRIYHPILALLSSLYFLYYSLWLKRFNKDSLLSNITLTILFGQILLGFINIHLLVPVTTQMLHLLLSQCLWISLIWQKFSIRCESLTNL
jgi:heme a synthase